MSLDYDVTNYSFGQMLAGFLTPEGVNPSKLGEYQAELHRAYSDVCRESAASGSRIDGGIVVRADNVGSRFIESSFDFLQSRPALYSYIKDPVQPWQLYYMFRSHLAAGENCPRQSPMGRRLSLLRDYRALRENLIAHSENAFAEGDVQRSDRIERLVQKAASVMSGLRYLRIGDDQLDALESLLELIAQPDRAQSGYLLLDLILIVRNGDVLIPPRFAELVQAAHGGGSNLFRDLIFLLSRPETSRLFGHFFVRFPGQSGADPDIQLARLVFAAANWFSTPVRIQLIEYTLDKMADPENRDEVEALLELLEDPEESNIIDNSASLDAYLDEEKPSPEFEFVEPISGAQFEITAYEEGLIRVTALRDDAMEFDYYADWEVEGYDEPAVVIPPMEWFSDMTSIMSFLSN